MKPRSDVELLAELEKEVVNLQTTIAVLRRRIGGTNNATGTPSSLSVSVPEDLTVHDKPYLGMNIPEAARKYLQRVLKSLVITRRLPKPFGKVVYIVDPRTLWESSGLRWSARDARTN